MGTDDERRRAEALERRVAELEAENEALRGGAGESVPEADPDPLAAGRVRAATLTAVMTMTLGGGAAFEYVRGDLVGATLAAVFALALLIIGITVIALSRRSPEGFALVVSGRQYPKSDGSSASYRVVLDGTVMLLPVIETAELLDCRQRSIEVRVDNAYCRGNVPLTIEARSTYKLARHPPEVEHAIERFLGRARREVDVVAQQTLEGHVREQLATRTEDELHHDRVAFAALVIEAAEDDLRKLGILLDDLRIEHVARSG